MSDDNKPTSVPPHERISTPDDDKWEPVKWSNASAVPPEVPSSPSPLRWLTGTLSALSRAAKDAWHGVRGGRRGE